MDNREYYVYEWIRGDTKLPFYVGKGKDDRAYQIKNNKFFKDVVSYCDKNSIVISVVIVEDNLTEDEAFKTECYLINEYICEFGFKMTNMNWGGEGGNSFSFLSKEKQEEYKLKMSNSLKGKNLNKKHTDKTKQKISNINKGRFIGENNPMYGKDVNDFMTEEQIILWKIHISESMKGKKHSQQTKNKIKEGNSKKVIMELNDEILEFNSRKECEQYLSNLYKIGGYIPKKLLKSGEEYNPRPNDKLRQKLKGMRLVYK